MRKINKMTPRIICHARIRIRCAEDVWIGRPVKRWASLCEDNELVRYRDDEHEIGLDGANVVKTPRLIVRWLGCVLSGK